MEMHMSQIRTFDDALDFYPEVKRGFASRLGSALRYASLVWESFREGQEAAAHYHQLRSRGVSHDVAANRVFRAHFH